VPLQAFAVAKLPHGVADLYVNGKQPSFFLSHAAIVDRIAVRVNAIACREQKSATNNACKKMLASVLTCIQLMRKIPRMSKTKPKTGHKTVTLTPEAVAALNRYCEQNSLKRHTWLSKLILTTVQQQSQRG